MKLSLHFFISQNNMILSKLLGQSQKTLSRWPCGFYEKGIALLLHTPSIGSFIIDVLCNPRPMMSTDENTFISETEFDIKIISWDTVRYHHILYIGVMHYAQQNEVPTHIKTVDRFIPVTVSTCLVTEIYSHHPS